MLKTKRSRAILENMQKQIEHDEKEWDTKGKDQ
jgi:hypothetical protein